MTVVLMKKLLVAMVVSAHIPYLFSFTTSHSRVPKMLADHGGSGWRTMPDFRIQARQRGITISDNDKKKGNRLES